MRRLLSFAMLLFACHCAYADTITNFNFNSDLSGGYTAQGTVAVDVTDGQVMNSLFTVSQYGVIDATFTQPDYDQSVGSAFLAEFRDSADGFTYELLLPEATLLNYAGGSVCTTSDTCMGYPSGLYLPNGGNAVASDGTLSLAQTPEPGSLILLASGLLVGYFWRSRSASNS